MYERGKKEVSMKKLPFFALRKNMNEEDWQAPFYLPSNPDGRGGSCYKDTAVPHPVPCAMTTPKE